MIKIEYFKNIIEYFKNKFKGNKKISYIYKVDYYCKVDKEKRYFAQRIINGKINNFAPNWAKYICSITIQQIQGKRLKIDYGNILKEGESLKEENRVFTDVCGPSFSRSNINYFTNFKMFFKKDVGTEVAKNNILSKLKKEDREYINYKGI